MTVGDTCLQRSLWDSCFDARDRGRGGVHGWRFYGLQSIRRGYSRASEAMDQPGFAKHAHLTIRRR